MKKILLFIFVLPLVLTACSETNPIEKSASKNIIFERKNFDSPSEKELGFILKNDDGSFIFEDDLEIVHEKKIHFIVVKDNLSHFQHLHPEHGDQLWQVKVKFPEQGVYYVYADFKVTDQPQKALFSVITIGNATSDKNFPSLSPDNKSIQDDITATINTDPKKAGKDTTLTFDLQKDNKQLTTLKPYLGAAGHVVILKHNEPELYLHVHPVDNAQSDGKLKFMTTFPTAGTYTAFLQVNNADSIQTFPFTFTVQPGIVEHSSMSAEEMSAHEQ